MAAAFLSDAQPDVIAAVTGTKGKSSIVAFLREIWTALGKPAASLGTVGVVGPNGEDAPERTPRRTRWKFTELLATAETADGVTPSGDRGIQPWPGSVSAWMASGSVAAGFTNITRDHMDYHPTFDDYLHAKLRLFSAVVKDGGVAVVNADAEHADAFIAAAKVRGLKLITVGRKGETIYLERREDQGGAQALTLRHAGKIHHVLLPQAGDFQASNALVAAGIAIGLGDDATRVFKALEHLRGAPGRMEKVAFSKTGAPIYVDYAHTPDSLEKVLEALRPHTAGRLHVVFGCGGDRDKGKRPLMGAIAARLADDVIVTDDNPRTEDAAAIRAEILAVAPGAREIGDRRDAIRTGIASLAGGDVLILAGKGHETGQYINGVTHPFSDRDEAVKYAKELGGRAA